jgi:hypothetical protein
MAHVRPALACAFLGAAVAAAPALAAAPPARPGAPVSSHAMLYTCCTPAAMKERMFAESKAMGARFLRVDVELAGIFDGGGASAGPPNWEGLDQVMELSRRHDLPVLGILMRPPAWVGPDAGQFGRLAAEVAAHARDTITRWEIFNEPELGNFAGTPADYARFLRAAYDKIKTRVPEAEVAMGGVVAGSGNAWLERVLTTPGADARHAFDIANVHVRGSAHGVTRQLVAWRGLMARYGFSGPVWVTEHGYPADPQWQDDPLFRGGEAVQGGYLTESILGLAAAGAAEVFVTLRDNHSGRFASEGVISIDAGPQYRARRKLAFGAIRRLVDEWGMLAGAYTERRNHEEALRLARAQAATAAQNVQAQRALARAARVRLAGLRARFRRAGRPFVRARLAPKVARATARLRERRSGVGWARASEADYRLRAALHAERAAELARFVAGG